METRDLLTADGRAVLLLCSPLGDADEAFTLAEWNQLAKQIAASPYQRPAALLGQSASALTATLGCDAATAERIGRLLERGGRVALELEGLQARGLWVVTRADPSYPAGLKATLKHQAPTVLFGAGEPGLLARPGIAVVGSRNIDEAGRAFAEEIGRKCAAARVPVVSGGARGTDSIAMEACLEAGGGVIGVLADSLERTVRQAELRQLVLDGRLVFVTPYAPNAGFSVGGAMGRNKIIYGLAEAAVVVSSDHQKGGTWAGAVEALRAGWCPVFVRDGEDVPAGNRELLKLGAGALPASTVAAATDLPAWLREHAPVRVEQQELLPMTVAEKNGRYRA
jgi:predicted Rossmann fold nucleotide-binding protein DprA/Smf involved in DNA uptake